jgi:ribosomal 50S subunit-associated protein YjgA (DUF615 family)
MAKREPRPKTRKLSETLETLTVDLTREQIGEQRALVCVLRDRMDALDEKLDSIKADFKGKAKELEEAERVSRRLASSGKQDIEVMIEDWLEDGLDGVRVVRRRADTMELVGEPRAATSAERQEALPLSGPPDDSGFGSS